MKQKSIGKNATLNMIRTVLTLLFPLITFPYISRILQVENLGKVNFVNSIVSYFVLFGTLGIKTYGTREGAALREDKKAFQKFYSEVFTITLIMTIISYIIMFSIVLFVPTLKNDLFLFIILGSAIILTTIGNEWICAAYEEYSYITIRSIVVQIISFFLIFIFIHKQGDYYKYSAILVFSSVGSNIFNYIYVRKYVRFKLSYKLNIKKHLRPMVILFASALATFIYVASDTTILGFLCGEYYTGLYSASTKIYSVVKNLISAIVVVSIPRFSYYFSNNMDSDYNKLLSSMSQILVLISIPAMVGVFMLSDEIIMLISGVEYIGAVTSLRILSLAIIFVAASWVLSQCILIPMKLENYVLYTTIGTAVMNVLLNLLLANKYQHNATAFTTLIAEATVVLIYYLKVRNLVHIKDLKEYIVQSIFSCITIVFFILLVKKYISNMILILIISILGSIIIYYLSLIIMKNKIMISYTKKFFRVLKKRLKNLF